MAEIPEFSASSLFQARHIGWDKVQEKQVREQEAGWDPVPHLAALIEGIAAVAEHGPHPAGGYDGIISSLADLLSGPYAELRGGLGLDEPGREGVSTEQAIRAALRANRDRADILKTTVKFTDKAQIHDIALEQGRRLYGPDAELRILSVSHVDCTAGGRFFCTVTLRCVNYATLEGMP